MKLDNHPQSPSREKPMKTFNTLAILALTILAFADSAQAKTQFDSDNIGMDQLEAAAAKCPGGVCPNEAACKAVRKLGRAVKAGCDNLEIPAGLRVKACNDMITSLACNSVGGIAIVLTEADCERQGKELKGGKCVPKAIVLTEADCERQGKELKGGKCVPKAIVLTDADCEKEGKDLRDGKCVPKAVAQLTQTDCDKEGKDLRDGKCVDRVIALTQADCEKQGKNLRGGKCVPKAVAQLTQADCDKEGKDLKDGVCVPKAVAQLTQADCDKEGKDLKDGKCVPKAVAFLDNVPGWLWILILIALLAAYHFGRQWYDRRKAEQKKLAEAKAKAKAEAEQKLLEEKAKAEGTKLPDLPAPSEVAKPEAPDAEKFVTRDELKATLASFLANDVELRVLEESLKNYSTDIATEEQLLGNLKEATPPDEVEIKRVERRIENLKFRQGEAEAILEQLRSDLKDRDKKLQ